MYRCAGANLYLLTCKWQKWICSFKNYRILISYTVYANSRPTEQVLGTVRTVRRAYRLPCSAVVNLLVRIPEQWLFRVLWILQQCISRINTIPIQMLGYLKHIHTKWQMLPIVSPSDHTGHFQVDFLNIGFQGWLSDDWKPTDSFWHPWSDNRWHQRSWWGNSRTLVSGIYTQVCSQFWLAIRD